MQTAVLKAIGVISKATDSLIKLKNTKNTNTINFKDALGSIAHEFTDSIAMLSQVNTNIEQNRKDSIAFSLGRKYYALRKNVPPESKELFGDDIAKRMATLINNKKLFESSSSTNTYFSTYDKNSKNLRRSLKTLGIKISAGIKTNTMVNTRNTRTTRVANIQKERNIEGKCKQYWEHKKYLKPRC